MRCSQPQQAKPTSTPKRVTFQWKLPQGCFLRSRTMSSNAIIGGACCVIGSNYSLSTAVFHPLLE